MSAGWGGEDEPESQQGAKNVEGDDSSPTSSLSERAPLEADDVSNYAATEAKHELAGWKAATELNLKEESERQAERRGPVAAGQPSQPAELPRRQESSGAAESDTGYESDEEVETLHQAPQHSHHHHHHGHQHSEGSHRGADDKREESAAAEQKAFQSSIAQGSSVTTSLAPYGALGSAEGSGGSDGDDEGDFYLNSIPPSLVHEVSEAALEGQRRIKERRKKKTSAARAAGQPSQPASTTIMTRGRTRTAAAVAQATARSQSPSPDLKRRGGRLKKKSGHSSTAASAGGAGYGKPLSKDGSSTLSGSKRKR